MKLKLVFTFLILTNFIIAQNVIVAVIDGARYTETFGAEATNIPHIWNDLKPLGTIYTNYKNTGVTSTNPGHASILTGTWQNIANDGTERPNKPTVFEYFRSLSSSSLTDNYVVAGKAKLHVMTYSTSSTYGASFSASVSASDLIDNEVYTNLINIMSSQKPKLIIVNFPEVDRIGHSIGTAGVVIDNYLDAITNADQLIFDLWNEIQSNTDYKDNTTLFVTNDHGRHTTDVRSHGDHCEGCTHLMLLAIGRNVTPNQIIADERLQIDIAPTIGDLLSFETPEVDGTSLFDGANPLPVELTNFTYSIHGRKVNLNWQTAAEVDNYGFSIERTSPLPSPYQGEGGYEVGGRGWETIGFVQGHGNSNSPKEYSFTDNNPLIGTLHYRLKQIDNDGTFRYSNILEISFMKSIPTEFALEQNYPNPFNPSTSIAFILAESGFVNLTVYNTLGEKVAVLINQQMEAGNYQQVFNAQNLSTGNYIYRITVDDKFSAEKKMQVLK